MTSKSNHWCAAPNCMIYIKLEKRHFFSFPKEHDRWLAWVQACGRLDLIPKGPDYAYRNSCLCHVHFEEKWYSIKKRARLHPDAVPTRFFKRIFDKTNSTVVMVPQVTIVENRNTTSTESQKIENCQQEKNVIPKLVHSQLIIKKPAKSIISGIQKNNFLTITTSKHSSQEQKLLKENMMLKAEIKKLRQKIRRWENARDLKKTAQTKEEGISSAVPDLTR